MLESRSEITGSDPGGGHKVAPAAYSPHALISFGGGWSYTDMPNEKWACTLRGYVAGGGGYLTNPQTYANTVGAALATWWATTGAMIHPRCGLDWVKANNILPNGHYKDPITSIYLVSPRKLGGGTATPGPAFLSIAGTFETGLSIGKARRGRMYLPNLYTLATNNGVSISSADVTVYANAYKALLAIFRVNDPGTSNLFRPAIVSRSGAFNDITGVSVNSVLDVQRRRKGQATALRSAVVSFP